MMRGTPARGPPVICLLDSSSSDEEDGGGFVPRAPASAPACSGDDSDIVCTGVVTASDREDWARETAVELELDSSQEPSESPPPRAAAPPPATARAIPSAPTASVFSVLAATPTPVKAEHARARDAGNGADESSSDEDSDLGDDIYGSEPQPEGGADASSSEDEQEEDLYGPPVAAAPLPTSAAVEPAGPVNAGTAAREHADSVAGWSEQDVGEFMQTLDAELAGDLHAELLQRQSSQPAVGPELPAAEESESEGEREEEGDFDASTQAICRCFCGF